MVTNDHYQDVFAVFDEVEEKFLDWVKNGDNINSNLSTIH